MVRSSAGGGLLGCDHDQVPQALDNAQAVAAGGRNQLAADVDHARPEKLGRQVDHPGAADSDGGHLLDGVDIEPAAGRVDRNPVDDTGACQHAHPGQPAFERRAGRTGAADEPVLVAQHHLGIGADVHQERRLLAAVQA